MELIQRLFNRIKDALVFVVVILYIIIIGISVVFTAIFEVIKSGCRNYYDNRAKALEKVFVKKVKKGK